MACKERRVRDARSIASAPLSRTTFRTIRTLPPPLGAITARPTAGRNPEQLIFFHYEFSKITDEIPSSELSRITICRNRALRWRHAGAAILVFAAFARIYVLISRCCDRIWRVAVAVSGISDASSSGDLFLLISRNVRQSLTQPSMRGTGRTFLLAIATQGR
jgi:hypothetical protein